MTANILIVDDEPNLLNSMRRSLRTGFTVTTAESGEEALEHLHGDEAFAVIISDMQMPSMNGLEFLKQARQLAPDTVRIMLTGNADQKTAIDAVNDGAISRFLTKPCPVEELTKVLSQAVHGYEVDLAEKQLLSKTLTGSMALLCETLAVANPTAFGRGSRIRSLASRMAKELGMEDSWQFEVAAMLSQFGHIGVPEAVLEKSLNGEKLDHREAMLLDSQSRVGGRLIGKIPRLEVVADIVSHLSDRLVDRNLPETTRTGIRMLQLLQEFDVLCLSLTPAEAIDDLQSHARDYDEDMLAALIRMTIRPYRVRSVYVKDIHEGMIIGEDVKTTSGKTLVRQGHELTQSIIERLRNFADSHEGVKQPFQIRTDEPEEGESDVGSDEPASQSVCEPAVG